jgi:hypothetical protein
MPGDRLEVQLDPLVVRARAYGARLVATRPATTRNSLALDAGVVAATVALASPAVQFRTARPRPRLAPSIMEKARARPLLGSTPGNALFAPLHLPSTHTTLHLEGARKPEDPKQIPDPTFQTNVIPTPGLAEPPGTKIATQAQHIFTISHPRPYIFNRNVYLPQACPVHCAHC